MSLDDPPFPKKCRTDCPLSHFLIRTSIMGMNGSSQVLIVKI